MYNDKNNLFAIICAVFFFLALTVLRAEDVLEADDFFEMSIEELMNVELSDGASLTGASLRLQPSAITTITEEQIKSSGARSLMELLDIYVPNLQWILNSWEPDSVGLRGIIGDRDDKYLLLVNGRVMNERTRYGVLTEKDLVFLGDINHIDVIRGPGSALYGPGAVSMVVNIITHNSDTFEGTEVTTRAGIGEEFYSLEVKHGEKFSNGEGGWFIYGGVANYPGANQDHSPVTIAGDYPSTTSWWSSAPGFGPQPKLPTDGLKSGDTIDSINIPNDGEAQQNRLPLKFHAQVNIDNLELWARYTRGGRQFMWNEQFMARTPVGLAEFNMWDRNTASLNPLTANYYSYEQATGFVGYKQEVNSNTTVDYSFSYDRTDAQRVINGSYWDDNTEEKYIGKVLLRHDFNEHHKIALGYETFYNRFDKLNTSEWFSSMHSVLGEYQWNINDQWTTFVGGRIDDHKYSDLMISPRASIIYMPNAKDTYKFMWSSSVRGNFEEDMRNDALQGKPNQKPEKLDSIELRYERACNDKLDIAASWYVHYNLELISWSNSAYAQVSVGSQRDWGLELEAYYHTDKTRFGISHSYAQLYDFNLKDGQDTIVTSAGNGYGNDLARWSTHITKLTGRHKIDDKLSVDGSFRVYWGFPGMREWDDYQRNESDDQSVEVDWEKSYRPNCYLNLGMQYDVDEDLSFRVDGMNLLGLFDMDINKRNYTSGAMYRSHAPSLNFSMGYKF